MTHFLCNFLSNPITNKTCFAMIDIWINVFSFVPNKLLPILRIVDKFFHDIINSSSGLRNRWLLTLDSPFKIQFDGAPNELSSNYISFLLNINNGDNIFFEYGFPTFLKYLPDDVAIFSEIIQRYLIHMCHETEIVKLLIFLLKREKYNLFDFVIKLKPLNFDDVKFSIFRSGNLFPFLSNLNNIDDFSWEWRGLCLYRCKTAKILSIVLEVYRKWYQLRYNAEYDKIDYSLLFHKDGLTDTIIELLFRAKTVVDFKEMIQLLPWEFLLQKMNLRCMNHLYKLLSSYSLMWNPIGFEYLLVSDNLFFPLIFEPHNDRYIKRIVQNVKITDLFFEKLIKQDQSVFNLWKNKIKNVLLRNGMIKEFNQRNQWLKNHNLDTIEAKNIDFFEFDEHREFDYDAHISIIDHLTINEILSINPKTKIFIASKALYKTDYRVIDKLLADHFKCPDLIMLIIMKMKSQTEINKDALTSLWQRTKDFQVINWEAVVLLAIKRGLISLLDWILHNQLYDFKNFDPQPKSKMFDTWAKFKLATHINND